VYASPYFGGHREHNLAMHWAEVWNGSSLAPRLCRALLTPASWFYTAGWNVYAALYSLGIKRPQSPHRPVICVGNLTVGGSGKTPTVVAVAEIVRGLGHQVVISCSGYGSGSSAGATIAPPGVLAASDWGDEPALLRRALPDVDLVVGRDRVQAARLINASFPDAVMLMDDGFQHLPLAKHITIILDPPSANRRCLPAGPYREPRSHRKRADLVLPGEFHVVLEQQGYLSPEGKAVENPVTDVNVLCAIGSPQRFVAGLQVQGLRLSQVQIRADHDPLSEGNLFAPFPADEPLIVTEKDWVKLRDRADLEGRRILIANYSARIEPTEQFKEWLSQKLHEIQS
jgi:tetraacyldisaccharide 4'-kinase